MQSTNLLIKKIRESWSAKKDQDGMDVIIAALDNVKDVEMNASKATKRESLREDLNEILNNGNNIANALSDIAGSLSWMDFPHQHSKMKEPTKICELIGSEKRNPLLGISEELSLWVWFLNKGVSIPQHAEDARVVLQVVACGSDSKIGFTEGMATTVKPGDIVRFPPTAPKIIKTGSSPMVLLLAKHHILPEEEFWFSPESAGITKEFEDVMAIENIQKYYENFAKNYENVMLAWGYCMPDSTTDAILRHGDLKGDLDKIKVLDLGCGDGLTAKALYRRGFRDITGVDFSSQMIEKSKARGLHKSLKQLDLLKDLPYEDNAFDLLVSTAVTTYLNPSVLEKWIRVAKQGGLIAFTHKTLIWDEWEKEHDRLEENNQWKLIWVSNPPIPYLPSLKEEGSKDCTELAKIYIYKKM